MNEEKREQSSFAKASEDKLVELEKKCDEYLNNWKRSAADLANYKKEEMTRLDVFGRFIKEDLIEKVLPIFDSIYLAETAFGQEGFMQIKKQIEEFLKKEGIEEIKVEGKEFDPATMEAIEEVHGGPTPVDSGRVVEELQKGYAKDGKVLRPAKVKVGK